MKKTNQLGDDQAKEAASLAGKQTIKEIFSLIAEGNERIQEESEKAILLLGKTGVGKSTLAYLLSGKQLKAVYEEEEDKMLVEAEEDLADIVISHKTVSETKVPVKQQAGKVSIWDCPGFFDNNGIAQEIANSFYITRLFETSKKMKFVLVASQESIDERGGGIVEVVEQLARTFKAVNDLQGHLSLEVNQDFRY